MSVISVSPISPIVRVTITPCPSVRMQWIGWRRTASCMRVRPRPLAHRNWIKWRRWYRNWKRAVLCGMAVEGGRAPTITTTTNIDLIGDSVWRFTFSPFPIHAAAPLYRYRQTQQLFTHLLRMWRQPEETGSSKQITEVGRMDGWKAATIPRNQYIVNRFIESR